MLPRAAISVLAVLLLAACGGSSSSSEHRFVARANAICAKAQARAKRLKAPGASAAGDRRFIEQVSVLLAQVSEELASVKAPASKRAAYRRFVTGTRREVTHLKQYAAALGTNDRNRAGKALAAIEANTLNAQAAALGLSTCARAVEPTG